MRGAFQYNILTKQLCPDMTASVCERGASFDPGISESIDVHFPRLRKMTSELTSIVPTGLEFILLIR